MMIRRMIKLAGLAGAAGAFAASAHGLTLLQEWDFASAPAGQNPTQVVGTVPGGLSFAAAGSGQLTNGSTLRVSPTAAVNSHIELPDDPNMSSYTFLRAEYDIAGWNWAVGDNNDHTRRLSIGFAGSVPGAENFLFAAGGSIRMNAAGEIRLTAESGGATGTFDSFTPVAPTPGFTSVHTSPLFVRIDWDVTESSYSVYFSDTAGVFADPFFTGRVGTPREPYRLRIGPLDGSPSGAWAGDYVDIDAMRLYAIPEPSTYAAIFGALALVGAFAYRRRKNRA
jgi:hypothetical protein